MIPEYLSLALNLTGTAITIAAAAYNALGQHRKAIGLWRYSNWLLLALFFGIAMDWWILNSGAWLQVAFYAVFVALNEYAIWRYKKKDAEPIVLNKKDAL